MWKKDFKRVDLFEAFIAAYLGKHIIAPGLEFPRKLIELTAFQKVAVAAPRFFSKSYHYSFFYPLFKMLEYPGTKVALVSATASLADFFLAKIVQELENVDIRADYGDQVGVTWRSDYIVLKNGSECRSFGAEKQLRGFHPDVIVCDDMETDEMVLSSERRKKFDDWFLTALEGTLGPEGQLIVAGTILHPHSFLSDLVNLKRVGDNEVGGWTTRFFRALEGPYDERGVSLFPEKWPLEALLEKLKGMGSYAFEQEFQNNPIPDSAKKFKEEWIKYYSNRNPGWVYFTAVDPASSLEKHADFTAIVTVGVDEFFNIYVVDVVRERLLPKEVVNAIFAVYQRFKPAKVGIETVGFQKMLKHDFELQRKQRGLYPIVEELKPDGRRKELRIQALQPRFQDGTIFLKEGQKDLVTELLMFPSPRSHDDIIDALAYTLDMIRPARKSKPEGPTEETFDMCFERIKGERAPVIWGNHNLWQ